MTTREKLVNEVESFLQKTGMKASSFGRDALKSSHFVYELRNGRDITLTTYDKIKQFMKRHKKCS